MRFVRQSLLPQDHVAVMAYNRATPFTLDHQAALETLEHYWARHEWIESRLKHHFSGLTAAYGGREIPKSIQDKIDQIFSSPALAQRTSRVAGNEARHLEDEQRKERELIKQGELAASRVVAGVGSSFDRSFASQAELLDIGFDEYVEDAVAAEADLENLYAAIRYLRFVEGEKHIVYVTPEGLRLPRMEDYERIAVQASDARVTIDILHTYGVRGGFQQAFKSAASQRLATLTGGQLIQYRSGESFFMRLDDATRTYYLVAYSPSNSTWDGRRRRIQVKVNRKSVTVLYRHAYFARGESAVSSARQQLMHHRIASAASLPEDVDGIIVRIADLMVVQTGGSRVVSATLRIPAGQVSVDSSAGARAELEVVMFSGDQSEKLVGSLQRTVEFSVEPDGQGFAAKEIVFTVRIPVSRHPKYLKAIVYDRPADRVGSAMAELTVPRK